MGVVFYSTLGGATIDRGAEVERRRRENRGAEGEGVSPFPLGRGQCPIPSPEKFSIADLKMVSFDAFCVVF